MFHKRRTQSFATMRRGNDYVKDKGAVYTVGEDASKGDQLAATLFRESKHKVGMPQHFLNSVQRTLGCPPLVLVKRMQIFDLRGRQNIHSVIHSI